MVGCQFQFVIFEDLTHVLGGLWSGRLDHYAEAVLFGESHFSIIIKILYTG